jgi:UDP-N-acetylglucosamine diphosphorylase/glucosamine-1-phosphate N-acetyltransferase
MASRLFVFDDAVADGWTPFALSRPCGELRYGRWLLRERLERFVGVPASGSLTRPWLDAFSEPTAPAVVQSQDLGAEHDRILISSRCVPSASATLPASGPANLWAGGVLVGCRLPAGHETPDRTWLDAPSPLPGFPDHAIEGHVLEAVWDLVAGNPKLLDDDLRSLLAGASARVPDGAHMLGDGGLYLGDGARVEPGVVFDAGDGPIWLDDGVEVRAGSRLAGPLFAGAGCRLLGGSLSAVSAGPRSYLRGEIEESVVLGWSNKAHDGFLGHAYLGRWVNLGALTTNSDLKNNYAAVRVGPPGHEVDTGLVKLGCLIGDHVKTGIGILLTTGAVLGAGSNVFGSEMPPKWVPPFSWGSGQQLTTYRREAFLNTAEIVLGRRDVPFDGRTGEWLGQVWDASAQEARG